MPLTLEAQLGSLPEALETIRETQRCGSQGEDLSAANRQAQAEVLRHAMERAVDRYLSELARQGSEDRPGSTRPRRRSWSPACAAPAPSPPLPRHAG
jgi:hypothetical protein